ncbi:MAG TPA: Ig-like domain-containing protein [Patescibacteria group bacterium]|nr:Ig-like domain-containing protein [Patescibacteria group bacterium]
MSLTRSAYNRNICAYLAIFCFALFALVCLLGIVTVKKAHAGITDTGIDTDAGETASTNPKTRTVTVSAIVRNQVAPSTPLLVSPENEATVGTSLVTFIWKKSTDDVGILKYQLHIDGATKFDNLYPPGGSTTDYSFTEQETTFELVLKKGLTEGAHTWKIRVYDTNSNYSESATWSFTIDSTSPILLVKSVGGTVVSISAQDISTIPTTPISLTKNKPVVSGTTESSTTVKLAILFPTGLPTLLSTTAKTDGAFSFTLPTLPLDTIVRLQITASDSVGNTSFIDSIPIIIVRPVIKIPLPISKILPPEIPIIPPEEIREEIKKIVLPFVPEPIVEIVDTVIPLSNSAIGLLIPLLRLLAVLWLTGVPILNFTPRLITKAAHAVGLFPSWLLPPIPEHKHGIVFDVDTREPIPFALVTAFRFVGTKSEEIVREAVTDVLGQYETLRLQTKGTYSLLPSHRDYTFPIEKIAQRFSGVSEVYVGQNITTDLCEYPKQRGGVDHGIECDEDKLLVHYLIPMEKRDANTHRHFATSIAVLPNSGLSVATLFMGIIAFFSPTPWNVGVFVVYCMTLIRRSFS